MQAKTGTQGSLDRGVATTLYRRVYRSRRAEEAIIQHYAENDMKTPMHMSMGEEAITAGVLTALGERAVVVSTYRSHSAYMCRTDDTDRFFAELYGKRTGTAVGKGGSMHVAWPERGHLLATAVVSSGIPVAVGAAFAAKQQRSRKVAVPFFGDGALDEGAFWESLNIAASMRLPTLFVCEDNGLSVHTPKAVRHGYKSITDVVARFDVDAYHSSSTDAADIYHLTQDAVAKMDATGRPAFLHLEYYRYLEHVGINEDFEAGYRGKAEAIPWKERDPVRVMRARLAVSGVVETEIQALEGETDAAVRASVDRAKRAPDPDPADLFTGVFHEAA